jgi:hypothetical protein
MQTELWRRIAGGALIAAGVMTVVFWFVSPSAADPQASRDAAYYAAVSSPRYMLINLGFVGLIVLNSIGLMGLGQRLNTTSSTLAFLMALIGTVLFVAAGVFQGVVAPALAANPATQAWLRPDSALANGPLGAVFAGTGLIFAIGYVWLGLDRALKKHAPRHAWALLAVSAPILGLSPLMPLWLRMLGCAGYGLALVLLGRSLWSSPIREQEP